MKASPFFKLLIVVLLSACAQPSTQSAVLTAQDSMTPPAYVLKTETLSARGVAATFTPSPSPSPTATLLPTGTHTPVPQPSSPYPALTIATELPPPGSTILADLHDLILFRSRESVPFISPNSSEGDVFLFRALTRFCHSGDGYTCLWGVTPDGQRAGMLNPEKFDFHMLLLPGGEPLFVENGFTVNNPMIQGVRLPDLCSQDPNSSLEQRCDQIQLSPNGRFLAFRYGPDRCGRLMQLVDRQTGETVLDLNYGVHGIGFLPNGRLAISRGHCEGSSISFLDPLTRQRVSGGGTGLSVLNQSKTLRVITAVNYVGNHSELWGYNVDTGVTFYPEREGDWLYDEHVIFLPDDRRFIYQHLEIGIDSTQSIALFDTPVQIVRYDPITAQRMVLASDLAYHYRLCQFDYEQSCPSQWYGDWIQIQRVPFAPQEAQGVDQPVSMVLPCPLEGQQCAEPPEMLALNASTGEIRPWDPSTLPSPVYPSPTPGLDLSGQPIYTDPSGQFALYIGRDGKTLWMLPKEGSAVQWVANAQDFFYLP